MDLFPAVAVPLVVEDPKRWGIVAWIWGEDYSEWVIPLIHIRGTTSGYKRIIFWNFRGGNITGFGGEV